MKKSKKGIFFVIISACAFGSIGITSKIALANGGDTTSIMINRFIIVSLFFWIYMKLKGETWKVGWQNFFRLLFLGFICYGNIALFFFLAMKYISPSIGSLILYTYPALVMAGSALFLGEKFNRRKLTALGISFLGCLFVLWGPVGEIDYRGILFAGLTALCYAAYIVGSRKLLDEISPAVSTGYMSVCCLVYFIIYGLATHNIRIEFNPVNLTAAAVLAFWCTILGFLAFFRGLKAVGAMNTAIISSFEPLFTILISFLIIGDRISPRQLIGGLIIVGGIVFLNLTGRGKKTLHEESVPLEDSGTIV